MSNISTSPVSRRDLRGASRKNGYRLDCIVCGKYMSCYQDLTVLDCELCKQFVLGQVNALYAHRKIHQVCNNCAVSTDICRNDTKSTFCDRYAIRYECNLCNQRCRKSWRPKDGPFIATQRINKLHEPLQWRWRSNIRTYPMSVSGYEIQDGHRYADNDHLVENTKVDDQYLRIFCKHKCVTCDRYMRRRKPKKKKGHKTRTTSWKWMQKQCKFCNNWYCMEADNYQKNWSNCGSLHRPICRLCYYKNERTLLQSAIYKYLPQFLGIDVSDIVYQYSIGFVIKCSNYARCKQEFCVQSWFHLEEYNCIDIDGKKSFRSYKADEMPNVRLSKKQMQKLNNKRKSDGCVVHVDDLYYRVLCNFDMDSDTYRHCDVLHWCDGRYMWCDCRQHPERFIGNDDCWYHTYLCVQDTVIECDVCGKTQFIKKRWCKTCESNVCAECRQNGAHSRYCYRIEKLFDDDYTMNEELLECEAWIKCKAVRYECFEKHKHVNKPKKATRTKTKNTQKRSSYWKRRNDRRGNAMLRVRRQKLLYNMFVSNDYMDDVLHGFQ